MEKYEQIHKFWKLVEQGRNAALDINKETGELMLLCTKSAEWIVSVLNEAVKSGQKTYGSGNTKVRLLTNDQTQQHDKFMQIVSGGEIIAALDSDLVDDATKFMEENHPEITDYRVDFLPKIVINKDKSNK